MSEAGRRDDRTPAVEPTRRSPRSRSVVGVPGVAVADLIFIDPIGRVGGDPPGEAAGGDPMHITDDDARARDPAWRPGP